MLTFLSLFSGIGGFDLGLEWAGWIPVGQIEVDAYARRVLERHWPHVRRRGDIRLVNDELACEWWGGVDAIVGGFPCTDVSCAGKGAGVEHGKASGLWREFARLIRCLRPRWVVVENVPALRTRGADLVLGDLEAAGYTYWPVVVGAADVGAPHQRKRVWIIGRLADADGARLGGQRQPLVGESASRHKPHRRSDGGFWPSRPGEPQHEWEAPRTVESGVGRATDGTARRLALKALGNSVVPQIPMLIAQAINDMEASC